MRKRIQVLMVGLCVICLCGFFSGVAPAAAGEIVLKAVTGWPANDRMSTAPFFIFQEMVNKRLKGKVNIKYLGGPEVIPSFDLIEAVRTGVVDIANLPPAYYQRAVPEVAVMNLSQLNHRESRQSGFYQAYNEVHQKKLNSFYYAWTNAEGLRYAIYLTKKIEKPDLTGLKLRGSPAYAPLIKALGASVVIMPPPEVYTSLERGVIDGMCWPNMGVTDYGWNEVVKYMIEHEFWRGAAVVLFNLDTWNKLPDDLRKELSGMAVELEDKSAEFNQKLRLEYHKLYKASGMQFIKFSPEDEKKYLDTIYKATREDFLKTSPDVGEKLLKLVTK